MNSYDYDNVIWMMIIFSIYDKFYDNDNEDYVNVEYGDDNYYKKKNNNQEIITIIIIVTSNIFHNRSF